MRDRGDAYVSIIVEGKKSDIEQFLQDLADNKPPLAHIARRRAFFGLFFEHTYEGEPAVKLESAALRGRDILKLAPMIKNNVLHTTEMVQGTFNCRNAYPPDDLAFSSVLFS